jgi:glucokinase
MPANPILGIDLGGTKIAAVLLKKNGGVIWRKKIATAASDGFEAVLRQLTEIAAEARTIAPFTRIGLALPGPLDLKKGVVLDAPNLSWRDQPVTAPLAKLTGVPVFIENDANAAAWGELKHGAGRGFSNFIYITVGTGIGAGIITNRMIVHGRDGGAGELGHVNVKEDGPPCNCGRSGCLEALASGTAIARIMQERLQEGAPSLALKLAGGNIAAVTAETVGKAATAGDLLAQEIISTAMRHLGIALANLVQILNPELIIIGGGLAKLEKLLFDPVQAAMKRNCYPSFSKSLRIIPPELGEWAGAAGAAAIALDST